MHPVLLELGPLKIYSYGAMVALGFWLGTWITAREYGRRGGAPERVWRIAVAVLVAAFLTSHLLAVAGGGGGWSWRDLVRGAGQVWYGALLGGLVAAGLLARRFGLDLAKFFDSMALGIPLGHAVGRVGCHLAGDGDWGTVTELPWGVAYTNAYIGWPHAEGVRVHPAPLYESAAYLLVFAMLWALRRRRLAGGVLFAIYLVAAALARFAIEFVRVNPPALVGLTRAQVISLALVASGAAWIVLRRRRPGRAP